MDEAMRTRLVAYINLLEDKVCAEWHSLEWPHCTHEGAHEEGLALLDMLGAKPDYPAAIKPDYPAAISAEKPGP